jgi:F0F1-type ATP synthase epsilon subunit
MTHSASNRQNHNPSQAEKDTQSARKSLSRKQKLEAVRKANQALLKALEHKKLNSDQTDAQSDV